MPFEVGQVVGDYEVLAVLARGGMGRVYRVRNLLTGRIEAMKGLLADVADQPEVAERFSNEVRTLAGLDHPNIAKLYTAVRAEGELLMVMEFVEGLTLADRAKQGSIALEELLGYIGQTLGALDYAHQHGVVHRDLKPSNIIITHEGEAKLVDFGVAKSEREDGSITRTGTTLGSVAYISPEQIRMAAVDARSDLYSLGVVLYELATGRRPYQSESTFSLLEAHLRQMPTSPMQLNAAISKELNDVILRAMAKEPEQRFQTAALFRAELERVKASLSVAPILSEAPNVGFLQQILAKLRKFRMVRSSSGLAAPRPKQTRIETVPTLSTVETAPPPPATVPGESPMPMPSGTMVFRTADDFKAETQRPPPKLAPPEGDFTRFLSLGKDSSNKPTREDVAPAFPDVGFIIFDCADATLIGRKINVTRVPFLIGRDELKCDFVLSFDSAVSATHAQIDYEGNEFLLSDLASSNGTFLNGKRLEPSRREPLLYGAGILLGSNTQLTFVSNELEQIIDLQGRTLAGRFELKDKLYASAKSVVYSAHDKNRNVEVAVKILSPRLATYAGYRAQFRREAEIASRVWHSNICPVLDFGETTFGMDASSTFLYVVMKHMEGGSLAQKLAREAISPEQVAAWMAKICSALDTLHCRGIFHGGLKLSAIVFSEDEPFLTDFAFARQIEDQQHKSLLAAPAYIAPEQWTGGPGSPASDLYAMGVVAYRCLTGSLPFERQENPSVREINFSRGPMKAHEMAQRNGRHQLAPQVSSVLARALSTIPTDRFQSGCEFAAALKKAISATEDEKPLGRPMIFISHHRPSSAFLAILIQRELGDKYDVFVDSQEKDTVGRFPDRIERKIRDCDVFVCLLAPDTLQSEWVTKEIQSALKLRKAILPVFQEGFVYSSTLEEFPEHVRELLRHDGVKFQDVQHHLVRASLEWLRESIENLVAAKARRRIRQSRVGKH